MIGLKTFYSKVPSITFVFIVRSDLIRLRGEVDILMKIRELYILHVGVASKFQTNMICVWYTKTFLPKLVFLAFIIAEIEAFIQTDMA